MRPTTASDPMQALVDLALLPAADINPNARAMARFSLFDWLACGRAGVGEPLAAILRDMANSEAGKPVATLFGGGRVPARMAALVNGATSHALDYDDTHFGHIGHPSVAIYPAALAAGEEAGANAADIADAFLVGAEASIRIGKVLGAVHYNRGFHQTATAGAFGATIAAGRLLGLDRAAMRTALSLVATRASGLKSQFGTMGKPYNAGLAAANGVECAKLAQAGFTSADDGIFGAQGFVPTHSDAPDLPAGFSDMPPGLFLFEDIKYKFHACCHGTHAMIEALLAILPRCAKANVAALHLRTNPRWLKVCDIKEPRTGLEVKFSYAWLAGMVFGGIPTGNDRTYTDALASDPELIRFARCVTVTGDASVSDMQAEGIVELTDGTRIAFSHDLAARLPHDRLAQGLRLKAAALLGQAEADRLWLAIDNLSANTLAGTLTPS